MSKKVVNNFTIIVDTNEQRPFFYDKIDDPAFPNLKVEPLWIPTGDYSIKGMHEPGKGPSITIERKSLPDLFGSTGKGRERLEKEFIRMREFTYAAIVIEADFRTIFKAPPELSQMRSKSVFRTVLAFCQRNNVGCFPCPNRQFAERTTYLLLERFWADRQSGGKMEFDGI